MRLAVLLSIMLGAIIMLLFLIANPTHIESVSFVNDELTLHTSTSPIVAQNPTSTTLAHTGDIERQAQLTNPPLVVKGVYATGWSAGSKKKMASLIGLIDRTELNAIVIDIKDYSGYVSYKTGIPEVEASGAEKELRIIAPHTIIKTFHDKGIYVIGRVSVFQDPILARARPELAMQDRTTGTQWKDHKGIMWMDPASEDVWRYNVAIARDALSRGFDEINFDYVRFASDGALSNIVYPFWQEKISKRNVIKKFFEFVRKELPEGKISADLFGLATVDPRDLGIGQVIEDGYENFDYVSPMIYPSHYATGFLGYKNPASFPYEVVWHSMDIALTRVRQEWNKPLIAVPLATSSLLASVATPVVPEVKPFTAKLRPWLQDFNLGATYTAELVRAQIRATEEALGGARGANHYAGWLLWNPSNVYTESALLSEPQ